MHAPLRLWVALHQFRPFLSPSRFFLRLLSRVGIKAASMEASGAINEQKEDRLHFQSFGATSRIPGTAVAISAPSD